MIRKLALALALWLAPLPALAALAIDSQESANTGHHSTTSPLSYSFTNTAGTLLIVGACLGNTNTPAPTITGVTYNGVSMSAISGASVTASLGIDNGVCTLYQLLSPATGSNTVSVSFDNSGCGGCTVDVVAGAISFTGNNTSTPTGHPATASDTSGSSTSATVSVSSTTNGNYVVSLVGTGTSVGTATAPTTTSWKLNVSPMDISDNAALGQQTTSGGTVSAGFSVGADAWLMAAVEVFAAGGAAPTPTNGLELVMVGGTLNHGDGSPGGGALAPGFFVSTTGNDNNPGTLAAPWLTIFHAQQVMRGNNCGGVPTGLCLTYVRGGTYNLVSAITFTTADKGETVQYYPPDGVNSAVIDGGNTLDLIHVDGNNITLSGLKLQHCFNFCIIHDDGTTTVQNFTLTNSDIGFNVSSSENSFPGLVHINGLNGGTFKNNYIHDSISQGLALFSFQAGLVLDNIDIENNVFINNVQTVSDGGAIYLEMFNNHTATSYIIKNNYVRDYGSGAVSDAHCIYLDEGSNHVAVSGNVCAPPSTGNPGASTGALLADGHDNTVTGNLIDLGLSAKAWDGVWWSPGGQGFTTSGNTFSGNIVIMSFAGSLNTSAFGVSGQAYVEINQSPQPSISNNAYHNYGGATEVTTGNGASDSSAQHYSPTQLGLLSCPNGIYAVSGGSTVTGAPVNFPALPTSWGPPGFTIPSSTNHSC